MTGQRVSKITGQPLVWEQNDVPAKALPETKPPPPPPRAPISDLRRTIHNEQVKLRATALNTTAAGFVVAGLITPLTAIGVGTAAPLASPDQAVALMGIWLVMAIILHFGGVVTLEATI